MHIGSKKVGPFLLEILDLCFHGTAIEEETRFHNFSNVFFDAIKPKLEHCE